MSAEVKFCHFQVILLGDFNAEGSEITVDSDFYEDKIIRILIKENKVIGACLVGETDCEEMLEQLILTSFDISHCPRPLSNKIGDIVDFFD